MVNRFKECKKKVKGNLRRDAINLLAITIISGVFCSHATSQTVTSGVKTGNDEPRILACENYVTYADGTSVYRGMTGQSEIFPSTSTSVPLSRNRTRLLEKDEIAVMSSTTAGRLDILDDSLNGFSLVGNITQNTTQIEVGDFDGDLRDEFIVVYSHEDQFGRTIDDHYDEYWIYDDATQNYSVIESSGSLGWWYTPIEPYEFIFDFNTLVEIGDFNGDGIDEIFLALNVIWSDKLTPLPSERKAYSYLYIRDMVSRTNIFTKEYTGQGGSSDLQPIIDLAAGDFDGDGKDEAAYIGYSRFNWINNHDGYILDDASNSFAIEASFPAFPLTGNAMYVFAAGDYDFDKRDELAILSEEDDGGHDSEWCGGIEIYDYSIATSGYIHTDITSSTGFYDIGEYDQDVGDVDGDSADEIFIYGYDRWGNNNMYVVECPGPAQAYQSSCLRGCPGGSVDVDLGDVDSDGRSEIIISRIDISNVTILDDAKAGYVELHHDPSRKGMVAVGDFDGDGFILHYTGTSYLQSLGPNCTIVALAAPPTYTGITQNYPFSYTAYGTQTTIGTGKESTVGCSSMVGFSFDQSIEYYGITVLSVSFGYSLTRELYYTNNVVNTTLTSESYASGTDENSIIFQRTRYDRYEYEIDSHPFNSSLVGTRMTIDLPTSCMLYQCSQSYYNNHSISPIGAETFNHTVGQPWTYPTWEEMDDLAPTARGVSSEVTVGQGTGVTSCTIQIGQESGSKVARSTKSEWSGGLGSLGGKFTYSHGVIDGTAYEIKCGSACVYQGCVGHILSPAEYEFLFYSYGLCVYSITGPAGNSYQVINYFVNGAREHYPTDEGSERTIVVAFIAGLGVISLALVIRGQRKAGKKYKASRDSIILGT